MKRNNRSNFDTSKSSDQPVRVRGLSIEVKYDNFDKAIRKFKKRVEEDGRLDEAKARKHYVKPTERKRIAKKAAIARHRRAVRESTLDPRSRGKH